MSEPYLFPDGGICRADNFRCYRDPHKLLPAFQERIKFIALTQTCQLPPKNSWESKLGFGMNQAGDCLEVGRWGRYHIISKNHLVGSTHCWASLKRTSLELVLEAPGSVPFNREDRSGSGLAGDTNAIGYMVFQEKSSFKVLSSL